MIRYAAYTLLVMGLASQALADPVNEPYQPELARMSTRNILGLHRRAMEGYAPMEQLCGDGDTCAEACGKGFSQCASKDNLTHCYNRSKKQECCPGGTGDACDNGYFCSADDAGKTWCCPDGLSLKECAQKYNIPGPLTSQAPQVSSTSTTITTTTTTTKPTKTKSADSSDAPKTSSASSTTTTSTKKPVTTSTTSSKILHHESTSKSEPKETSSTTPTTLSSSTTTLLIDVSSALVATAGVTAQTTALDLAPSSTPSTPPASSPTVSIGTNGSGSYGPANALVLLIAGALAALV